MTSQDFHFRCALLKRAKSALAWKAQLTRRAFSLQAFLCALYAVAGGAVRSVTKQKACGKQRVGFTRIARNTKKRQLNFKIKKIVIKAIWNRNSYAMANLSALLLPVSFPASHVLCISLWRTRRNCLLTPTINMAKAKVARRLRWHNFLKTRRDAPRRLRESRTKKKSGVHENVWLACSMNLLLLSSLSLSSLLLPLLRHILKRCHAKFVIGSTRSPRGREKTLKCASLPNSATITAGFPHPAHSLYLSYSVILSHSLCTHCYSLCRGSLRGSQICHNLKSCAYVSHLFVVVIVAVVVVAVVTLHNHCRSCCCCVPTHARQSAKCTNSDTVN